MTKISKQISALIFVVPFVVFGLANAYAHHASAVEYDHGLAQTIQGTVTALELINPHTFLYLDVQNEKGETEQWLIEGPGKLSLARRGWVDDTVMPGDIVIATGHPAFMGRKAMWIERIVLSDGSEFLDPAYADELAIEEERRQRSRGSAP